MQAYSYSDIQECVLKSLIAHQDIITTISQGIDSDDFDNVRYREIYKAILNMALSGQTITSASLYNTLKETGVTLLDTDLLLFVNPPIDSPDELIEILKSESVKHSLKKEVAKSIKDIEEGNTFDEISKLNRKIEDLSKRLLKDDGESIESTLISLEAKILADEEEMLYTIPTPYKTLNKYIGGGLKPSKLFVVAARPGVGKTVVATQLAANACEMGKSVLFFSLEMPKEELLKRMIATSGNVMLSHLSSQKGRHESVKTRISKTVEDMKSWKLEVLDETDVTIEHIRKKALKKSQSPEGLDMIIVDYLQLISTRGLIGANRQERVAEISRYCKVLSRQLEIPVVVLVQLKRADKTDNEERIPGKEDIKESGAIEADADQVLVLHRKRRDDSIDPKIMFILDKNREGPSEKKWVLRAILEKNTFHDYGNENGDFDTNTVEDEKNLEYPKDIQNVEENTSPISDFGDVRDIVSGKEEKEDYGDIFGEW